jgi:predicted unusual protein kinase regulating ubiquinone biosynthesis (AarF/ABC1/UbiB family)
VLQSLAARIDLQAVPEALRRGVRDRLGRVATVEPLSWKEVERVLRDAWGSPPARVLASLDRSPVAVRPASQVHRGVTGEGRGVAVKLLRPGVAQAVRSDLGLADAVAALVGGVVTGLDAGAVAGEVRERVLDELDLEYEGAVQRGFHRALRRHAELGVPAVHSELTHETVLVTDWVDGVALAELRGDQRTRAARLLLRFHLGAALHGTVDADPDVRDALLDPGGRLWIVDLGASRAVSPERVALATGALDALAADDARRLGAIVAELGWLSARDAREGLALARRVLGGLLDADARLDAAALRAVAERALASEDELVAVALRGSVAPEDLWPLRMLGTLFAELATLGATGDWVELAREALRDGW